MVTSYTNNDELMSRIATVPPLQGIAIDTSYRVWLANRSLEKGEASHKIGQSRDRGASVSCRMKGQSQASSIVRKEMLTLSSGVAPDVTPMITSLVMS